MRRAAVDVLACPRGGGGYGRMALLEAGAVMTRIGGTGAPERCLRRGERAPPFTGDGLSDPAPVFTA